MSRFFAFLLVLSLLLPASVAAQTPQPPALPETPFVGRIFFQSRAQLAALSAELDVWEVHPEEGYLLAALTPLQAADLQSRGYAIQVDAAKTALLNRPPEEIPYQTSGIPGYPCYRTVEETYADLSALAADHPDLAQWTDIGDSWEKTQPGGAAGYDIYALVLTNRNIPGPKPTFFLMAAIHARELTTAETAARFAEYLVNNYGSDPEVTWLLDFTEIHIVPQVNPDGRKMAEAGLYWRKNTDNDDGCTSYPDYGTDLNRNSSYMWGGAGASTDPCSETYRGPAAASEPEVQAIQNYVAGIFPDQRGEDPNDPAPLDATGTFITLHSYSQLVLWPWGFDYPEAPNHTQLQTLGRKFAYFNGYDPSQSSDLYPAAGTTDDWAYGDLGVAAYTFELGTAFFQSCAYFENTVYPDNLPALLYAASTSRRPYQTPAGPDTLDLTVTPTSTLPGASITITAQADDTRYGTLGGPEPSQDVTAARFSIDTPSWVTGTLTYPLQPADGAWDSSVEAVVGQFDPSALGLAPGRHTLFVEAQDAQGNWGAPTAVFFWMPEYGFQVSPLSVTGYGMPGETVTYTLRLTNSAALSDTYVLELSPAQWESHAPRTVGPLDPGETAPLTVTVSIPAEASYGDGDRLRMIVTSRNDSTERASVTLQTFVPDYQPSLSSEGPRRLWGLPGETLTYTLRVRNTGNLTETYALTVTGNAWNVNLPPGVGASLPPGGESETQVTVDIPAGTPPDASDVFTVTAISTHNPAQTASISLTAGVPLYTAQAALAPAEREGPPGAALAYTLRLTNTGNITDTYLLTWSGGTWPLNAPAETTLPPAAVAALTVTVTVPLTAPAGLTQTWQGKVQGSGAPLSLTLSAQAAAQYGVEAVLRSPQDTPYPGTSLTATLRLTNTGNITDTFALTLSSTWTVEAPVSVTLGAWQGTLLPVRITVPPHAADGEAGDTTLTAASRNDPAQQAAFTLHLEARWQRLYLPFLQR